MRDLLAKVLETLEANHKWHQDYDECGGYPDSQLCLDNEDAIRNVRIVLARYEAQIVMARILKEKRDAVIQTTTGS